MTHTVTHTDFRNGGITGGRMNIDMTVIGNVFNWTKRDTHDAKGIGGLQE